MAEYENGLFFQIDWLQSENDESMLKLLSVSVNCNLFVIQHVRIKLNIIHAYSVGFRSSKAPSNCDFEAPTISFGAPLYKLYSNFV